MNRIKGLLKFSRRNLTRLNSVQAYALWAKSYPPQVHNPLMAVEQAAMLQLMPELKHRTVLDLACGTGRYGLIALEQGAQQVIGVDNSMTMLEEGHLTSVLLGSVETIPVAAKSVDVIICGLALGHVPQLDSALREMSRVLRPGGCLLISDFHPFQSLNGARRTFRSETGAIYEVEHHVHLYSDYHRAGQSAGLHITAMLEPGLINDMPVVLVLRYEKIKN